MGQGVSKKGTNKIIVVKEKVITLTNGFKLDKFRYRKDISKNWFTNKVVNEWNKLSKHVVFAETVNTFKKKLDIAVLCRSTGLLQPPYFLMFLCCYVHQSIVSVLREKTWRIT